MTERHRSSLAVGVLLGLCVLASSAAAANRYVGKPGRDVENDCLDPSRPCKTISRAVSQAGPVYAGGGIVLVAQVTTLSARLRNAIVWGNTSAFDVGGDDLLLVEAQVGTVATSADHSDIGDVQGFGTLVTDLGGNVNVDPQLVAGRLVATSTLIDAGTCVGQPTLDIDGQARPTGAACDIGADEFVP